MSVSSQHMDATVDFLNQDLGGELLTTDDSKLSDNESGMRDVVDQSIGLVTHGEGAGGEGGNSSDDESGMAVIDNSSSHLGGAANDGDGKGEHADNKGDVDEENEVASAPVGDPAASHRSGA